MKLPGSKRDNLFTYSKFRNNAVNYEINES